MPICFEKVVSALPSPLVADAVYFVRVGAGIDIYVANSDGTQAHKHNSLSALPFEYVTALPGAPLSSTVYYYERPDGKVDHWITNAAADYKLIHAHPVIYADEAIKTHQAAANIITEYVNVNIDLPYDGDYEVDMFFNWNVDAANTDGIVYATLDGNALDLNDRTGDPQGNNQILRLEQKEAAAGSGGSITGTGTGQKDVARMLFDITETAGVKPLIVSLSNEGANVETSIWNLIVKFKYLG